MRNLQAKNSNEEIICVARFALLLFICNFQSANYQKEGIIVWELLVLFLFQFPLLRIVPVLYMRTLHFVLQLICRTCLHHLIKPHLLAHWTLPSHQVLRHLQMYFRCARQIRFLISPFLSVTTQNLQNIVEKLRTENAQLLRENAQLKQLHDLSLCQDS